MATDWIATIKKALDETSINSSDFDLNRNAILPNNRKLSKAGVLVGICFPQQGEPSVLLTKRASHLTNHPGQVAFPGGKFELQDSTLTNTALREAEEEIGLDRSIPQKLGVLPNHETITRFLVSPVRLKLYKGSVSTVGRWSEYSLYSEKHVTFEDDAGAYDQNDAAGFIQLNALRLKLLAHQKLRNK